MKGAVFQLFGHGDPYKLENWGGSGYRWESAVAFLGIESVPNGMFSGVVRQVSILNMSLASSWISGWVIASPEAIEVLGSFR